VAEEIRTRHAKLIFNSLVVSRMSGEEGQRLAAEVLRPDAPVREYVDGPALEPLFDPKQSRMRDPDVRSTQLFAVSLINRWLVLLQDGGRDVVAGDGYA
jgi:hypothetical protein